MHTTYLLAHIIRSNADFPGVTILLYLIRAYTYSERGAPVGYMKLSQCRVSHFPESMAHRRKK